MPNPVLDLRNIPRAGPKPYQPPKEKEAEPPEETRNYSPPKPDKDFFSKGLLEWTAYEYAYREHGPAWFLTAGGAATLLIVIGILAKSYFFIAFVALAFVVIMLYAKRKPQKISFVLTKEGVKAGRKFYNFSDLKSFWIFEKSGAKELSLETSKTLAPFVRLPLGDTDPKKIRKILNGSLPEKEHKELVSDQIAKNLGL